MISWISNFAPTSTPLVGSSSSSTRGDVASHLASDDLLLIAAAQAVGRDVDAGRLDPPLASRCSASRAFAPGAHERATGRRFARQHQVVADDQVEEQPLPLPFLGHERDAGARGVARRRRRTGGRRRGSSPDCGVYRPKIVSSSSERPGSDEAEEPDDLAGVHLQRHVLEAGPPGQAVERRAPVLRPRVTASAVLGARRQVAADHRAHDVVRRRRSRRRTCRRSCRRGAR